MIAGGFSSLATAESTAEGSLVVTWTLGALTVADNIAFLAVSFAGFDTTEPEVAP